MALVDGVLTGEVTRHFDEHDKATFVTSWCEQNGYEMSQVVAVGDARSDVPLFGRVGFSIALNATPEAQLAASLVMDTDDLRDVLGPLGVS
jgi:phosphoserine phosphatase